MDLQKVREVQNKHAKIITAKLLGSLEANPLMIGAVELALIAYDKERALAELEKPDDVLSTLIDNAIRRAEIEYLNENHPEALKEIQQRDLPDFARFENRSNTTTDVDK